MLMGGTDLENEPLNQQTEKMDDNHPLDLKKITIIALSVFVTFCCCILFFFVIYRYNGFADFWNNLIRILQPVIIGIVVAYLLNPVVHFLEGYLLDFLEPRMKNQKKAKKTARGLGICGALLMLIGIFVLLLAAIIPSMLDSIQEIIRTLPKGINTLIDWLNDIASGDSEIANIVEEGITRASEFFENWVTDTLLPMAQTYLASITSGVITGVKFLLNVVVGLIISIYVMASKETFAGQVKRLLYATFKPVRANVIIRTARKSNEIFGGFITGKILDSVIIGIIAYIVLSIMKMPDTILVSVIVGVTNIIPFFGPFIGAVPSFLIIVLQNPMQGIYFLIFIVILQQIDGNIIGPKILGNSTGLSAFWVVFAILVFGGLWGFVGMLLGVPVMAVIYYVVQEVVSHLLKKRGIPETEIDYVNLKYIDKKTNQPEYFEPEPKKQKKPVIRRAEKTKTTDGKDAEK